MSAEYRLDIHTAAGVKVAEVTDFLELAYSRQVNTPGLLTFSLPGDHTAVAELVNDGQVIVYRRNRAMGLTDWTADFWGLFRGQTRQYTDRDLFTGQCPGILTMLGRRIVAWQAGVTNRSAFDNTKAETVMKTLVSYNVGVNATVANGRLREGTISGISVEADGASGNSISHNCAYDNLLTALQNGAAIGGGDFDLVKTGAQAWEFRWYTGQLGTDRTATLLFALERGNMAEPEYDHDRTEEYTVAIVGGQGEESDREIVIRTGPDYAANNNIETFVDGRNYTTTAGLESAGDARLEEGRSRARFGFSVLQIPSCYYGVHYGLGDLVTAQYGSISAVQKITGVSVSLDRNGAEQIDVEMEAV